MRNNDNEVSGIRIQSIKDLSALKIKEYTDRLGVEQSTDASLRPQRITMIETGRDLRVNSINLDATNRDVAARAEADRVTTAQTQDAQTRINLTTQYNNYITRIKDHAAGDLKILARESAFYAANSVHREVVYTKGLAPLPNSSPSTTFGSTGVEAPPDFK